MSDSSPPSAEPLGDAPEADDRPAPKRVERRPLTVRSIESLDWPLMLEALADCAATARGRQACLDLPFLESAVAARAALAEVTEMMALRADAAQPPLGSIEDVRSLLGGAAKGEILGGPSLVRIAHTLEGLGRLYRHCGEHAAAAPRLLATAHRIRPLDDLAHWLIGSFDARGELSATTYPQLSSLRGRKAKLHGRIRDTLDVLRGKDSFEAALQDDFLAMRNDRYVVPVKASSKRAGIGIVHDASGSGQTVFIEPFEVVELNNDLKIADAELQSEERRILRDLSERVAVVRADITRGLDAASHLDVVAAKAALADQLEATVPEVPDEPIVRLVSGRHPILVLRGVDVVSNDATLGGGKPALVLSGPNTGGKTVTLKTLGMAALLVRAGLAVPAAAGTRVGFFDHVLTDIGDQQDVSEDLSTFSGHVLCLVEILAELARPGQAVVLVDEIAAGTDPVQGAALGRALLLSLLDRGCLLATTTHYPELKALAATDERFTSGRVEFDADAGRPTYRLSVGKPGSSHALDVAARVGLPEPILDLARSFMDPTAQGVEDLLAGLETELTKAREDRAAAQEARREVEQELLAARSERDALQRKSRTIDKDLRAEFEREVRGYRASVRGAMKEIRDKGTERAAERARDRISQGASHVRGALGGPAPLPSVDELALDALAVGDRVRVGGLGKEGAVVTLPDKRGRLQVEIDGMRVQVKASDLERARTKPKPPKKPKKARPAPPPAASRSALEADTSPAAGPDGAFRTPDATVDLRGQRVDEALDAVDQFLDDASMRSLRFVFILHGLGTGALRNAVRQHLKRSAYVRRQAPGNRSQGGDGITVVELK